MRDFKEPGQIAPWLNFPQGQEPIWIHCASGEFEYAKPVIKRLKIRFPDIKILVTYFSPSIAKTVQQFKGIDFSCPVPWDQERSLREFILWHRPRLLLIARTDTWPEMLRVTQLMNIPSLLFSATLPPSAGRVRGIGRWAARAMFENLSTVFCVSQDDLNVFKRLGFAERTHVMGDTRYDQVQERLLSPKPLREALFGENKIPLLVAGSTWPEDENVLLEVASELRGEVRFVFVPHEPTPLHLQDLIAKLERKGLKSILYSEANSWPQDSVLIVNKIGILAELYMKGRFAFVGGSFRKTVHSVMEPLAAGCVTFVGPFYHNNREALEFARIVIPGEGQMACVQPVCDAQEFTTYLRQALELPASSASFIREQVALRSGKSDLVVNWCQINDHSQGTTASISLGASTKR